MERGGADGRFRQRERRSFVDGSRRTETLIVSTSFRRAWVNGREDLRGVQTTVDDEAKTKHDTRPRKGG
jgi:hypothetical protein